MVPLQPYSKRLFLKVPQALYLGDPSLEVFPLWKLKGPGPRPLTSCSWGGLCHRFDPADPLLQDVDAQAGDFRMWGKAEIIPTWQPVPTKSLAVGPQSSKASYQPKPGPSAPSPFWESRLPPPPPVPWHLLTAVKFLSALVSWSQSLWFATRNSDETLRVSSC